MSEPGFVAASPAWWRSPGALSVCIDLGDEAGPALETLRSVAAHDGPSPEVVMLAPSADSASSRAVQDWMIEHLWLPALVVEGDGADELRGRARSSQVITLRAGQTLGDLAEEIVRPPAWMYPWDLGELGTTPVLGPELPEIHQTRLELMEATVRRAFEQAGPRPSAIDLGSAEGWFAHRLLEWGAARVVALDLRAENIERARLVRDHLGIPAARLELVQADILDPAVAELGTFDVVLALSLVYHLEDPVGALRVARRMTRRVCLLDLQLTRQDEPVSFGVGSTGIVRSTPASFAAVLDPSASESYIGGAVGAVNMLPNRAAVELTTLAAGFREIEWLRPQAHHNQQYRDGDRAVVAAHPGRPPGERRSWLRAPGLPGRIHENDDMLFGGDDLGEGYARQARTAVEAIERALALSGKRLEGVDACLDLPCGYGRVTRLLRERLDPGRITACDVNAEGVAYCAYEYGVKPLLSDPEFEGVPFETYDLMWVGSLVTHLDRRLLGRFIELLPRIVQRGGTVVITTLGEYGIGDVSRYEERFAAMQASLERSYRETGFAFVPYEGETELGYAWQTPEMLTPEVESLTGGELRGLAAWPRGWDDHQDVVVFGRA